MSDFSLFLGKFLRQGTAIASLAPSSPWLARTTVRNIEWSRARVLVELGAGTGPITREIARNARPGCKVVVLERDPDFARLLRARFPTTPDFEVVEGDARALSTLLAQRGIGPGDVDHVISGLPTPSLPRDAQRDLFRAVGELLAPEGSFNQITEMPLVYWRFYKRFFRTVEFAFEPRNLPPAGTYFCRGVKGMDPA